MVAQLKAEGRYDVNTIRKLKKDMRVLDSIFLIFYIFGLAFYLKVSGDGSMFPTYKSYSFLILLAVFYLAICHFLMRIQAPLTFYIVNFGTDTEAEISKISISEYPKNDPRISLRYFFHIDGNVYRGRGIANTSDIDTPSVGIKIPIRYCVENPVVNGLFTESVKESYFNS